MPTHTVSEIPIECPACGSQQVSTRDALESFDYGSGDARVTLSAMMPTLQCSGCGLQYTDGRAEILRHNAVCAYLGVLNPEQIRAIRQSKGMSRQRFADITRIGSATLARWEAADVIQNPAMDVLLRLVDRPEVFALLVTGKYRNEQVDVTSDRSNVARFPTLAKRPDVPALVKRAQEFRLAAA